MRIVEYTHIGVQIYLYMSDNITSWFNNISVSPKRFPQNSIQSISKSEDTVTLLYNSDMTDRFTVFLPLVSLSVIPNVYKIDVRKSDDSAYNLPTVCIYGSTLVENGGLLNDEIIDETFVKRFHISDDCKFKHIMIAGTFGDYNSMVNCINILYDRLSDKSEGSNVCLYLESRFMKDSSEMVTLVEAITSGYIPHNISSDINFELCYEFRKFSLYNKTDLKELFDENYTRYSQFND